MVLGGGPFFSLLCFSVFFLLPFVPSSPLFVCSNWVSSLKMKVEKGGLDGGAAAVGGVGGGGMAAILLLLSSASLCFSFLFVSVFLLFLRSLVPCFFFFVFFVLSSLFSFLFSVFLFSHFLPKNPYIFLLSLMSLPCFFRSLSTPPKNLSLCFSSFLFFYMFLSSLSSVFFFFCFLTPKSSVHSSLFFSKSFSLLKNSLLCSLVLFLLFFSSQPPCSPISPHIYKQGERGHPVLSRHGIG